MNIKHEYLIQTKPYLSYLVKQVGSGFLKADADLGSD